MFAQTCTQAPLSRQRIPNIQFCAASIFNFAPHPSAPFCAPEHRQTRKPVYHRPTHTYYSFEQRQKEKLFSRTFMPSIYNP